MNAEHVELQNRQNTVVCIKKRKPVKVYQNSPNLHFAYDIGEVSVFRGKHRLFFNLLKATTKECSACLGPRSKVKGDFLVESQVKVNMSSTWMIRKNSAMNYPHVLVDSDDNAVTVFLQSKKLQVVTKRC